MTGKIYWPVTDRSNNSKVHKRQLSKMVTGDAQALAPSSPGASPPFTREVAKMSDLVFKRKLHVDREGCGRITLPRTLISFLGLHSGGPIAFIVDTKSSTPSLILRKDVEEA